jgi:hypothetical protein
MRLWDFFASSWRTFGRNWATFPMLVAISTFTPKILALAVKALAVSGLDVPLSLISMIAWIASGAVWMFSTMALTMAAYQSSEGDVVSVWESYARSAGFFWRYLWTVILLFLIVCGGLLLLILPGILWALHYFLAPHAVIIEGVGGRQALRRSMSLTRGRSFQVLVVEIGFGLLCFLLFWIPLHLLVGMIGVTPSEPTFGFSPPPSEWAAAIELFGQLVSGALFVIFNVLLFKSLRAMESEKPAGE